MRSYLNSKCDCKSMTSKRTKMLKRSLPDGTPLTFEQWQQEILRCEGGGGQFQSASSIGGRIQTRLNELDKMMREGVHLSDTQRVEEKIESVSKFWSHLSDEDRDYLNAVRHAFGNQEPWK